VFVVTSIAHLYSQQWKHFENREYGGICTCGYSSLHNFQNLVLLMPPFLQILCTFEFTYSYTSVFVVFIGNNTNVCTVSSNLRRILRCGCGQPTSCTNASKHSLAAETYTFSRNAHEFPWMVVILPNETIPFFNCSTFLLK
jgi:hypothetical protein